MDLELNNLQRLICRKTQTNKGWYAIKPANEPQKMCSVDWTKIIVRLPEVWHTGFYIYIYIYIIIMTRKSGKHLYATYGTAVSTLLDLISSAYRDLHH